MSRYTPEQIEEDNRKRELQMDIDYSCVEFGKWINQNANPTMGWKWEYITANPLDYGTYTTEELYQLYKNEQNNK